MKAIFDFILLSLPESILFAFFIRSLLGRKVLIDVKTVIAAGLITGVVLNIVNLLCAQNIFLLIALQVLLPMPIFFIVYKLEIFETLVSVPLILIVSMFIQSIGVMIIMLFYKSTIDFGNAFSFLKLGLLAFEAISLIGIMFVMRKRKFVIYINASAPLKSSNEMNFIVFLLYCLVAIFVVVYMVEKCNFTVLYGALTIISIVSALVYICFKTFEFIKKQAENGMEDAVENARVEERDKAQVTLAMAQMKSKNSPSVNYVLQTIEDFEESVNDWVQMAKRGLNEPSVLSELIGTLEMYGDTIAVYKKNIQSDGDTKEI